jgi:hypothetical protein
MLTAKQYNSQASEQQQYHRKINPFYQSPHHTLSTATINFKQARRPSRPMPNLSISFIIKNRDPVSDRLV